MTEEPPPPVPPSGGKSRSGCLLALYIALGIVVAALLALAIGAWVFVRSETGQRFIEVAREGISLTREAARAPGTDALRAAGCSQAMVMSMDRMFDLLGEIAPEARQRGRRRGGAPMEGTLVFCQMAANDGKDADCARLARTYAEAVPDGPERFGLVVQASGNGRPVCQGTYGRDGTFLEPLERQ
jgi:hypothetical protein